jgi:hypothetical protein
MDVSPFSLSSKGPYPVAVMINSSFDEAAMLNSPASLVEVPFPVVRFTTLAPANGAPVSVVTLPFKAVAWAWPSCVIPDRRATTNNADRKTRFTI